MEKKNLELYDKALKEYGIFAQVWMMIEECGELLNAIAKLKRGRANKEDIITELADVHIMVEQLAYFYGLEDFQKEKDRKLVRLNERLKKRENIK